MKKIMFNDRYGLTEAVLEGRKTMTRRIVPKRYLGEFPNEVDLFEATCNGHAFMKGEVVAVAQSYKDTGNYPESYIIDEFHPNIEFEAGWNNKMFVRADLMPHLIRITDIKVERLQDISDEDCIREGIEKDGDVYSFNDYEGYKTPQLAFKALIDKVSGKGTWESNPYVFVYEFELLK